MQYCHDTVDCFFAPIGTTVHAAVCLLDDRKEMHPRGGELLPRWRGLEGAIARHMQSEAALIVSVLQETEPREGGQRRPVL